MPYTCMHLSGVSVLGAEVLVWGRFQVGLSVSVLGRLGDGNVKCEHDLTSE